jgi:hypothetical protein
LIRDPSKTHRCSDDGEYQEYDGPFQHAWSCVFLRTLCRTAFVRGSLFNSPPFGGFSGRTFPG